MNKVRQSLLSKQRFVRADGSTNKKLLSRDSLTLKRLMDCAGEILVDQSQ
ncbi:hypothetical protein STRDD11_01617 [Streptococcus sp. DD11]|nr:hypothetical protein STRDD11_01617 [Streptococcus sp. DD11]